MKPYPRANISEGDGVSLSVDLYNRMVDDIERLDRLSVTWPLTLTGGSAGSTLGIRLPANAQDTVLVALISAASGGGRYNGAILTGSSSAVAANGFSVTSATGAATGNSVFNYGSVNIPGDGMVVPKDSSGNTINNALVMNLFEQGTNNHVLLSAFANTQYVVGRVMGMTTETTPRTIVYIDSWTARPAIACLTTALTTATYGGGYSGRLYLGTYDGLDAYTSAGLPIISSPGPTSFNSSDDCYIFNVWEQALGSGSHSLTIGLCVPVILIGVGLNAAGTDWWHYGYTWMPPKCSATTINALVTTQTAGSSFGVNEQAMMNNLKTDVTNLQAELKTLYQNMQRAGYSS